MNFQKVIQSKWAVPATIIAIYVLFYLLDQFGPFMVDDGLYAFTRHMQDGKMVYEPINSFMDAFNAQFSNLLRDRIILHLIVRYFAGVVDNDGFRIINSIMFVVMLILVYRIALPKQRLNPLYMLLFFTMLVLPYAPLGASYMANIAVVVNYQWGAVANLSFLYLYFKNQDTPKLSKWTYVPILLVCAICATLQESFTIGIGGAIILSILLRRDHKLSTTQKVMAIGYIIGLVLVIVHPEHLARFFSERQGHTPSSTLLSIVINTIRITLNLKLLWVLLGLTIIVLKRKKESLKQVLLRGNNLELVIILAINILFCIFIAYTNVHQTTFSMLLTAILMMRLVHHTGIFETAPRTSMAVMLVILAVCYVPVYALRSEHSHAIHLLHQRMVHSKDQRALAIEYERVFDKAEHSPFGNFLLEAPLGKGYGTVRSYNLYTLSLYLSHGRNEDLVRSVYSYTLPQVQQACMPENSFGRGSFLLRSNPQQIILRYPRQDGRTEYNFQVKTGGVLSSHIKKIFGKQDNYSVDLKADTPNWEVHQDEQYIYFLYPFSAFDLYGTVTVEQVDTLSQ